MLLSGGPGQALGDAGVYGRVAMPSPGSSACSVLTASLPLLLHPSRTHAHQSPKLAPSQPLQSSP